MNCDSYIHQSKAEFCFTHRVVCCRDCHANMFDNCKVVDLETGIAQCKRDVLEKEMEVQAFKVKLRLAPDLVADECVDTQRKVAIVVTRFFADVREAIDRCEQNVVKDMRDRKSRTREAIYSTDEDIDRLCESIGSMSKKISKLNIIAAHEQDSTSREMSKLNIKVAPDPNLEYNASKCASALSNEQNTPSISTESPGHNTEQIKMLEQHNAAILEMDHICSSSRDQLGRFEEISSDISETISGLESAMECFKGLLTKALTLLDSSISVPTGEFVKRQEVYFEGSAPVLRFSNQTSSSPLIVGTANPHMLLLVSQDGVRMREFELASRPYDICVRKEIMFVTQGDRNLISQHKLDDFGIATTISVPRGCHGIDSLGDNLLVTCPQDKCLRLLSNTGDLISKSNHSFMWPTFVCASERGIFDAVYVSDEWANSVVVLSPDLQTTLRTITHTDLIRPAGICLRTAGYHILVCSSDNHCVLELSTYEREGRTVVCSTINPHGSCYQSFGKRLAVGGHEEQTVAIYEEEIEHGDEGALLERLSSTYCIV